MTDVEYVINPYEEYALEQGVQLKEKYGGEVTVLTLGPEKSTQMIQKALALGADNAIHLRTASFPDDPSAVARALAAELKDRQFDVLLFGKKGVDDDNHQVGEMVSELLGIPCATQIVKLDIKDGNAVAVREVEGGSITIETSLPLPLPAKRISQFQDTRPCENLWQHGRNLSRLKNQNHFPPFSKRSRCNILHLDPKVG